MKRKTFSVLILILAALIIMHFYGSEEKNSILYGDYEKLLKADDSYSFDVLKVNGDVRFEGFWGLKTLYTGRGDTITVDYDIFVEKGDFKLIIAVDGESLYTICEGSKEDVFILRNTPGVIKVRIAGRGSSGSYRIRITPT